MAGSNPGFLIKISDLSDLDNVMIPDEFAEKHGSSMGNSLALKVPIGETMWIGLTKNQGHIYLSSGWNAFVRAHGINVGSSVAFKFTKLPFWMDAQVFNKDSVAFDESGTSGHGNIPLAKSPIGREPVRIDEVDPDYLVYLQNLNEFCYEFQDASSDDSSSQGSQVIDVDSNTVECESTGM